MTTREKTKRIIVGGVAVGGGAPVSVQSMCCTKTQDVEATLRQISALAAAGCEIVRLAVPDMDAARRHLRDKGARRPCRIVADIHFDYKLAVEAARARRGQDTHKPRQHRRAGEASRAVAREPAVRVTYPIRIGVNGGSLEKRAAGEIRPPDGRRPCVRVAQGHITLLNDCGFDDICLSHEGVLRAADGRRPTGSRRRAALSAAPRRHGDRHGLRRRHQVRRRHRHAAHARASATPMRVSLTADPVEEVARGRGDTAGPRGCKQGGVRFVSCPTCGRTEIDLIGLAARGRGAPARRGAGYHRRRHGLRRQRPGRGARGGLRRRRRQAAAACFSKRARSSARCRRASSAPRSWSS